MCWPCHCIVHRLIPADILAASFHSIDLLRTHGGIQAWLRWAQQKLIMHLHSLMIPHTPKVKKAKTTRGSSLPRESPKIQSALDTIWAENRGGFPRWEGKANRTRGHALRQQVRRLAGSSNIRKPDIEAAMRTKPEWREWHHSSHYGLGPPGIFGEPYFWISGLVQNISMVYIRAITANHVSLQTAAARHLSCFPLPFLPCLSSYRQWEINPCMRHDKAKYWYNVGGDMLEAAVYSSSMLAPLTSSLAFALKVALSGIVAGINISFLKNNWSEDALRGCELRSSTYLSRPPMFLTVSPSVTVWNPLAG
ncbi:hypothetical protein B0H14DRAFT_2577719 [Mycena olivaceomarginata]|nr:hypothetical protein B0H14DRAFT_2577719 [Mycena olivaceomarginata]